LPCAPCYLRELRHCRHGHACMGEVAAADVIARMETILASARAPAAPSRELLRDGATASG